ncbi:hypothetical protein SH139x_005259 [Planctomycetaceae bacterium SH139]
MGKSSCQRTGTERVGTERIDAERFDAEQRRSPSSEAVRLPGGVAFRWDSAGAGVFILAALGCASVPLVQQHVANLAELSCLAESATPLGYRGCDERYHYFRLPAGNNVSLPRECWQVSAMPVKLGWCIPLVFEQDRLVIPSSEWSLAADLNSLQWTLRE